MSAKKPPCHNASRGPCTVCGRSGTPCARCRLDYYCGKEHQVRDWARHKLGCGVLVLGYDPRLGRHLLATRDIPARTVIMKELPLVVYPSKKVEHEADLRRAFCVGCCDELLGEKWAQCSRCGWPVCSPECSEHELHRRECEEFQRVTFKLNKGHLKDLDKSWWEGLAALRTYLASRDQPLLQELQSDKTLKNSSPEIETIMGKNSPNFVMHIQRLFETTRERVQKFRRNVGLGLDVPEEELIWAAKVNSTNGLNIGLDMIQFKLGNRARLLGACVFAGISMLEHACRPNVVCSAVDAATRETVAVTTRAVRRGEHLSISYLPSAEPLGSDRRRMKLLTWGFVCNCDFCSDPTEMGLYLGSLCCTYCASAGKKCFVTQNCARRAWLCEGCGRATTDGWDRWQMTQKLRMEVDALVALTPIKPGSLLRVDLWENFIDRHVWPRGPLHATHDIIVFAKQKLVIRAEKESSWLALLHGYKPPTTEMLDHWMAMVRDVLRVLDVAFPGIPECVMQHVYINLAWRRPLLGKTPPKPAVNTEQVDLAFLLQKLLATAVTPADKALILHNLKKELDGTLIAAQSNATFISVFAKVLLLWFFQNY